MRELTKPYTLIVTIGYGIGEAGNRYDICHVQQIRNHKVAQPEHTHDRTGYYWKSLKALLRDDYTGCWDKDCHLIIYQTDDFAQVNGVYYD